jgi:pimeloyl-ACP methyl ester carboxylesterase
MWQPQIERLRDEYRVIALDLPGHGALRDKDFSLDAATEEIAEVIDKEAGGRALVAGLSLGGYVAMEFGARYPSKVAGLVIANACVEPSGWYNFPYRGMAFLLDKAPQKWTGWMSCKFFSFVYPDEIATLLTAPGFYARGGVQAFHELFERRFQPALAAYTGPVLLLNGARDLGFRLQERQFLAAAQNGRLEIIPKAFHIANLDQPEAFTQAIRGLAKSIQ